LHAQFNPSAATDADGDFVIAWVGATAGGNFDSIGRRFNAAGQPQGGEFIVNTATGENEQHAAVAMDATGDFVIVWSNLRGGGANVYARRYNAAGVPKAGPAVLTATAHVAEARPDVAVDADGEFVVAWTEGASNEFSIFAQRFRATGAQQGSKFPVQTFDTSGARGASVAMDADGDFVVAWESYQPFVGFARRYDAAGMPLGAEFRVLKQGTGRGDDPVVAIDADGDWAAALVGDFGIVAQRFGRNEAPASSGLSNVNVPQDAPDTVVNLWAGFDDVADEDGQLAFAVVGNTNPALFSSTAITPANGRLTLDYAPGQTGQATLTVRATDTGGLFTEASFVVTVTPPLQVTDSEFVFQTPPHRLRVTFSQDVSAASLGLGDLTFVLVGPPSPPQLTPSAVAYDPATRTVTFTLPPSGQQFLANGNYRATLAAGSVSDTSGNPLAAASVTNFFALTGDINRDRAVNGSDFAILAGNFGRTGMAYAQGDLNGDGSVNGSDFALLAGNFGKSVPAPAAALTTAGVTTATATAVTTANAAPPAPVARRKATPRQPARAVRRVIRPAVGRSPWQ
jgi:hypothetical protein